MNKPSFYRTARRQTAPTFFATRIVDGERNFFNIILIMSTYFSEKNQPWNKIDKEICNIWQNLTTQVDGIFQFIKIFFSQQITFIFLKPNFLNSFFFFTFFESKCARWETIKSLSVFRSENKVKFLTMNFLFIYYTCYIVIRPIDLSCRWSAGVLLSRCASEQVQVSLYRCAAV